MAKEQWHDWCRYLFLSAVIVFAGGGYAIKVDDNTKDIGTLQEDTKDLKEDVHKLELSDKDIANLTQNVANTMSQVLGKLDAIQEVQTKQATIQAVNSEKLKTLTKD